REVWNNAAYRELRRSLSSGRSYSFCRFCYLVEPVDEALWGSKETRFKLAFECEQGELLPAGSIPAGVSGVITSLASGTVPEGTRLEIRGRDEVLGVIEATRAPTGASFNMELRPPLVVKGPRDVWLRCSVPERVRVELSGFTD